MWRLKSPHFKCSLTCLLTDDKIYHNLRTAILANYMCSRRRLRSYCSFAQYYYSLRCALLRLLHKGRVKRICVLQHMRAATVQVSLRIRAVSQEPSLFAHTNMGPYYNLSQRARTLLSPSDRACAKLNGKGPK